MIKILTLLIITNVAYSGVQANSLANPVKRPHWLDGPDFKVETTVKVVRANSAQVKSVNRLTEYYSNEWGRARLDLSPEFTDGSVRYYYNNAKQLVKEATLAFQTTCKPKAQLEFYADLYGTLNLVGYNLLSGSTPQHIVGLMRLAFIVQSRRDEFEPICDPPTIRNHATIGYSLKFNYNLRDMRVYYTEAGNSTTDHDSEMPLQIMILLNTNDTIVLDYTGLRLIDYNLANKVEKESLFMIPTGLHCSKHLDKVDLLQSRPEPRVISFKASVNRYTYLYTNQYFIAHDGYASVMRRDTVSSSEDTHYTTTITDFGRQRKYHVKQPVAYVGERELQIHKTGNQCVVSKSYSDTLSIGDLIPFKSLVEMGPAIVRGIESVVFELMTDKLPVMLFPPIGYIDSEGKNYTDMYLNGIDRSGSPPVYTLLYYFVAPKQSPINETGVLLLDGKPLGPLMRIKVLAGNVIMYTANIEDFVWQLADAPNGDKADELFSVSEKCSGDELRAENYATMNLELEMDTSGSKINQIIAADQLVKILASPIKRNNGLLRALTHGTSLAATQIRDLESRVHRLSDDMTVISVAAKLYKPSKVNILEAVSIGTGSRVGTDSTFSSVDDCYWRALHKSKRANLLFTFCRSYCTIDDGVSIIKQANNTLRFENLKKIRLSKNYSCQVYRVAKGYDDIDQTTRKRWVEIGESLQRDSLQMLILEEGRDIGINISAKKVEIFSDRWSVSGSISQTGERALEGIGLSAASLAVEVSPKRLEDSSGGYEESLPLAMNYAVCHSSCVASTTCRAFSLCSVGAGELECLLSPLEFRDPDLLNQIEQQSGAARFTNKRQSIIVSTKVPAMERVDENITRAETLIELRVDKRCHLYNKRLLELFSPAKFEYHELRNKNLIATDSEEQCADICLKRNRLYFKRAVSRTKSHISDADVGSITKLGTQEERNLRSFWCPSFGFFDLSTGKLAASIREKIDSKKLTKRGLCHIAEPPKAINESSQEPSEMRPPSAKLHNYEFIYSSLYQPQQSIRLLASPGKRESYLDKMSADELWTYLRENNHQAYVPARDVEDCSRRCFMQNTPVKPWCKSFAFIRYNGVMIGTSVITKPQYYCIFNSITVADAKKSPLRDRLLTVGPKNMSFCHYEPWDDSLTNLYTTTLGVDKSRPPSFKMETMSLLSVIILMALISGIVFTLILGDKITEKFGRAQSTDHLSNSFLNSGEPAGGLTLT